MLSSVYSEIYSDMSTLVRALITPRAGPMGGKGSPRLNVPAAQTGTPPPAPSQDYVIISTKSQYINYLKGSFVGSKDECLDRYAKYNSFFHHDPTLSGQISARETGPASGRLDTICDFLGYAHWCFALGYAYALRDFSDHARVNMGNKCFTYQEFCASKNRMLDNSKVDEYLSRIIDEIMFYNSNIRGTEKNTVAVATETRTGPSSVTSMSWKGYNTDTWVQERIPVSEMIRLLCM
ncbi:MAG: hypothetical protein FWF97_02630 [Alphaproteobacteria bacterium]|nr:hypothetical protein [Alphaproteobacteria bacterium]